MAHTPGPWSLSEETVRDGLRSKLIHGMPEGMLAIVRVEHQGRYYGDANARLIAAAPDMLEALRAVALILPQYAMKGGTPSDDEALDAVTEQVSEAILKATGT